MFGWPCLKKIHICILCLLLILLVFLYNISYLSNFSLYLDTHQKHLVSCYFEDDRSNTLIELNPNEVAKNSIFFIETSCNHKNGINLNLRQGCAIESVARLNPNLKIFVLFVGPSFIKNESNVIQTLNIHKNVYFRHINFVKYSYNTPLQNFVASKTIFTSQWPVSHTSDLLRYLTLWKFGGTYLDLDVVLMKLIYINSMVLYILQLINYLFDV